MVAHTNATEPTSWIRTQMSSPASVLLFASDTAQDAGIACQNLLTTVSERSESILAIEYSDSTRSWLDYLDHEPTNMHHIRMNDGDSLCRYVKEFVVGLGKEENGIVYIDSLSTLVTDLGVENTAVILADTISVLESAGVTGFFRLDSEIVDTARFEQLVDYTATYVPEEQKWQVSLAEHSD